MAPKESQSLQELHAYLRQVVALNFPNPVWVEAEIAAVKEVRGNLFIDLVENDPLDGLVLAQAPAVIWQATYRRLLRSKGPVIRQLLVAGMRIQLQVTIDFHERYGYKLLVQDLDVEFTIGALEQKKQETIRKLRTEGLLETNSALPWPAAFQHIAVISSPKAAGLQDFMEHIQQNPYDYRFRVQLYPATVQGERAPLEIAQQFSKIGRKSTLPDAVVLIRGGGARTDLLAFDDESLCRAAAALPIPLLTGIGHETDQSILDLVAASALKTPTAVADFLVNYNLQFESSIVEIGNQIERLSRQTIAWENQRLVQLRDRIRLQAKLRARDAGYPLESIQNKLHTAISNRLQKEQLRVRQMGELIQLLGPEASFSRGYVRVADESGTPISSVDGLNENDGLTITFRDGKANTRVERIEKP